MSVPRKGGNFYLESPGTCPHRPEPHGGSIHLTDFAPHLRPGMTGLMTHHEFTEWISAIQYSHLLQGWFEENCKMQQQLREYQQLPHHKNLLPGRNRYKELAVTIRRNATTAAKVPAATWRAATATHRQRAEAMLTEQQRQKQERRGGAKGMENMIRSLVPGAEQQQQQLLLQQLEQRRQQQERWEEEQRRWQKMLQKEWQRWEEQQRKEEEEWQEEAAEQQRKQQHAALQTDALRWQKEAEGETKKEGENKRKQEGDEVKQSKSRKVQGETPSLMPLQAHQHYSIVYFWRLLASNPFLPGWAGQNQRA